MLNSLIKLARKLTANVLIKKRLPADFGNASVFVSSRADIRLLAPGLEQAAGDLFIVTRKYIQPGNVVWDIGSNLGILTFCAALKVGTEGEVFSLEADPRYADIQSRTLFKFPQTAANVNILCAAAANEIGLLELMIPRKGHARNHLSVVSGNAAGTAEMSKQVLTVTLDWLLEKWREPDFVKIDVEGAEKLVISQSERLFSKVRPLAYIECAAENSDTLTEYFKKWDYKLFVLDGKGNESPVDSFAFNTVAKPAEKL